MAIRKQTNTKRAGDAGGYYPNQFMIELDRDHALLNRDGTLRAYVAGSANFVFIHEYVHYLENISTASGFKSLLIWESVLAIFSHTLDAEAGESGGSARLDPADQDRLRQLVTYSDLCNGDDVPADLRAVPDDAFDDLEVLGVDAETLSVSLPNGTGEVTGVNLRCNVTFKDRPATEVEFILGATAIEEGLAYEIDRMVEGVEDPAVPFPYRVLREYAAKAGPNGLPRIVLAACAALALQTVDPPRAIINMFDHLSDLVERSDRAVAAGGVAIPWAAIVDELVEATRSQREQLPPVVLQDLRRLIEMHAGRGAAERAMRGLAELFSRLLDRRVRDPLFELRPFQTNRVERTALARVLGNVLPCDVLQENAPVQEGGDEEFERDWLLRWGEAGENDAALDGVRLLQCQLDFVIAHVSNASTLTPTHAIRGHACPFHTCCPLALRREHTSTCGERPWEITRFGMNDRCWYGMAVLAINHRE